MRHTIVFFVLILLASQMLAQQPSQVWVSDLGNGMYQNPIIHADYSDPDVIRVADDYYMVSSSFNCSPALPVLHSKDLVNWQLIAHALPRQVPVQHFEKPRHGQGVWAPSIRHHKGEFYLYYPDPDFGIYLIKTTNPAGTWSKPLLVKAGQGLIDPCPLWDENGKVYLVHAFAGSRAGIKSVLMMHELNAEGTEVINEGVLVFDGHEQHPTVEGPKLYKRNNYYYISAPAGGVSTGWQLILRSKNIYGPYEEKIVLDQGSTKINGPHQGAWVDTPQGEWWFVHFQDKGAYGRVVHLQPMLWKDDWPIIGTDKDGNGKGEPVLTYRKPKTDRSYPIVSPSESDEFSQQQLGLQWQWHANPNGVWAYPMGYKGFLRLFSVPLPKDFRNYWDVPNLLLQKFPSETFETVTKFAFQPKWEGEKAGLIIMGGNYAYVSLLKKSDGTYLTINTCKSAEKGEPEQEHIITKVEAKDLYLKVRIEEGANVRFAYSTDGNSYQWIDNKFVATEGKWIGAKVGIFTTRPVKMNDAGFTDFDYFRISPVQPGLEK